ncbi:MAG: prepilin-type cleavage/methylation domain-containing protein [Deltaproteobacteria bacterium]|nr:prepilin-type cleavage/methylation domain-containing protein [Deltaproteobacteria bacterium]
MSDLPRKRTWPRKVCVQGFMLIELAIVFAIICTLAAIAIPAYTKYRYKAQIAMVITEIRIVEKEIENYAATHGEFPDSLADINMDIIEDAWGNSYQYLKIAGGDLKGSGKDQQMRKDHFMVPVNTDYDLYSMGPDGKSKAPFTAKEIRDDIVRANDGKYVGRASEY